MRTPARKRERDTTENLHTKQTNKRVAEVPCNESEGGDVSRRRSLPPPLPLVMLLLRATHKQTHRKKTREM